MKIAVVGTGYVGLVAGTCFAENGNDVICVDKDPAKVRLLQRGKVYEPGLEELGRRNRTEKGSLYDCARSCGSAVADLHRGRDPTGEDGSADLQHVMAVARDIGRAMNGYKVIVNKAPFRSGPPQR